MAKDKAKKLALIANVKVNEIEAGNTTTTDARVSPMAQSLGITFDANKNVSGNTTTARITNLENIDSGTRLDLIEAKLNSIATLFNITFDANGLITSEDYSTHTHS